MAGRDRRHGCLILALLLVVVVAAAGAGVWWWRPDLVERWWPDATTGPAEPGPSGPSSSGSAAVQPAPDVSVAPAPTPEPVAGALAPGGLDPVAVERALRSGLGDRALGRRMVAAVASVDGTLVYRSGPRTVTPASTTKLLTAVAALEVLGPDHAFTTRAVRVGQRRVVLVGGGDPYLARRRASVAGDGGVVRADVVTLADRTARQLRAEGVTRVRVGYDASLFDGPGTPLQWEPDYVPDDVVSPISALWVDRGRDTSRPGGSGYQTVADPAADAAQAFVDALAARRIRVVGPVRPARAPGDAPELAALESAPLDRIVEHVLEISDNEAAEVLGHHVGVAVAGDGSFVGGVAGVRRTLAGLGVPLDGLRLFDASGLSRQDRLAPETLLAVLRLAADPEHPELRTALTGLPVAGFTGSLSYRFGDGAAAGRGEVRAKTGTLTGVHGLAGMAVDREGTPLLFVLAADRVRKPDTLAARARLDRLAARLAACVCSAPSPGG